MPQDDEDDVPQKDEMNVLCFSLATLPEQLRLPIVAGGALLSAILFAWLQEMVFYIPGFKFGGFMALLTSLTFCLWAAIELKFQGWERKGEMKDYLILSFCTAGGIYFTNKSLQYINYPMRVMFKSSKLIPVMIMGFFVAERSHTMAEYGTAALLVIAIICFALGDAKESPKFDLSGIFLISIGVMLDAVTSNFEEKKFFRDKNCSQQEVIFYSFALGSIWTFVTVALSGELTTALAHSYEHPEVYMLTLCFSTMGYLSVVFVLLLIKLFSATVAEAVKSVRKVVTIIISFVFFGKNIAGMHIVGFFIFIGSIAVGVHGKLSKSSEPAYEKVPVTQVDVESTEATPVTN